MRLILAFSQFSITFFLTLLAKVVLLHEYLKTRRKYVVIIIFSMAALLTPDPITQID